MDFSNIKTIVFDYDGTLHDTARLYGCAFRKSYEWLVEQGYASPREYTDQEVSHYLGMNAHDMWLSFRPDLSEDIRQYASGIISREMDRQIEIGNARLYENVTKTLERLKMAGYKLVILSNCRIAYIEKHSAFFGLDKWFSGYYPAEKYGFISKEQIFPKIMEEYQGQYLIVGDRDSDFAAAKVWNTRFAGCLYGFGTREELEGADLLLNDISELAEILC